MPTGPGIASVKAAAAAVPTVGRSGRMKPIVGPKIVFSWKNICAAVSVVAFIGWKKLKKKLTAK